MTVTTTKLKVQIVIRAVLHSCNVFILHFSDTAEIKIFVWGHAHVPMSPDIPMVDFSHEFEETYQVLVPHIIVPVSSVRVQVILSKF